MRRSELYALLTEFINNIKISYHEVEINVRFFTLSFKYLLTDEMEVY